MKHEANPDKKETMAMIGLKVPDPVKDELLRIARQEQRTLGNLVRLLLYVGAKEKFGVDLAGVAASGAKNSAENAKKRRRGKK